MGKTAMMAAALNAGMSAEAIAGERKDEVSVKVTTEQLHSMEGYQRADDASQEIFDKVDKGEYKFVKDDTLAQTTLVGDDQKIFELASQQNLWIQPDLGKIINRVTGEGFSWDSILKTKDGKVINETDTVEISIENGTLIVKIFNSDKSLDLVHYDSHGAMASVEHLELNKK